MPSPSLNGTVLIVEDDCNTANLVRTYLEREGFATLVASDGRTALQLFAQQPVDFLQQLARADAAKVLVHRTQVVPAEELKRMLDLYQQQFSDKAIAVTMDLVSTAHIMADRDKLLQAMRNLFENCWKYTPAGGQVRLTVTDDSRELTVAFQNSGPGIAAEDLPFIFERFFRADRSRSRKDGGFGIGLSIVKQLIEAQGGRVGAESDAENTTIWFALPLR